MLPDRASHPRESTSLHSGAALSPTRGSAHIPNTHHNGLPQLLVCADLRQEDRDPFIAHTAHIRDSAHRRPAISNTFNPDRAAREQRRIVAYHKVQNQAPPLKPERTPSATIPRQHHAPVRRALLPPRPRSPGMDNLHLQLQQGDLQNIADRRTDYQ